MSIGIYKITSPTERVYIGQSSNISKRFNNYQNLNCKQQTRLYRSLLKHGVDTHTFEIIEECPIDQLNIRERHWQDFYDVLDLKRGLNCNVVKSKYKSGYASQQTKDKMRGENNPRYKKEPWNKGLTMPHYYGENISQKLKGKLSGDKHPMFGKTHTEDVRKAQSELVKRGKHPRANLVVDLQTGIFFDCVVDAAEAYGINVSTLRGYLKGRQNNKTNLKLI